jgi:hypothetical protein
MLSARIHCLVTLQDTLGILHVSMSPLLVNVATLQQQHTESSSHGSFPHSALYQTDSISTSISIISCSHELVVHTTLSVICNLGQMYPWLHTVTPHTLQLTVRLIYKTHISFKPHPNYGHYSHEISRTSSPNLTRSYICLPSFRHPVYTIQGA